MFFSDFSPSHVNQMPTSLNGQHTRPINTFYIIWSANHKQRYGHNRPTRMQNILTPLVILNWILNRLGVMVYINKFSGEYENQSSRPIRKLRFGPSRPIRVPNHSDILICLCLFYFIFELLIFSCFALFLLFMLGYL